MFRQDCGRAIEPALAFAFVLVGEKGVIGHKFRFEIRDVFERCPPGFEILTVELDYSTFKGVTPGRASALFFFL